MPTRNTIRAELGSRLGSYVSGTSTSGSTTTVVVNNDPLFIGDANSPSADLYEDAWVYPTSGDNISVQRQVKKSTGFAPTTGTLTVQPAWSNAIAASVTFEVHSLLPPSVLHDCINRALRNMYHVYTFPLTLMTDGDMEASTATNWTGTNATVTKTTTAAQVLMGVRALSVVSTAAGGYAQSASISVEEAQT